MPPTAFPKQASVPLQAYSDNNHGHAFQGLPMSGFSIVDDGNLDACIFELESARKLGLVQAFIRDNRYETASSISDKVRLLMNEIEELAMLLKIRLQSSGSWAGISVILGYCPFSLFGLIFADGI